MCAVYFSLWLICLSDPNRNIKFLLKKGISISLEIYEDIYMERHKCSI